MLPSSTLLGTIKGQGISAGYSGEGLEACPHEQPQCAKAWRQGWVIGTKKRAADKKLRIATGSGT